MSEERRPVAKKPAAKEVPTPPLELPFLVTPAQVLEGVASCLRCRHLVIARSMNRGEILTDPTAAWMILVFSLCPVEKRSVLHNQQWSVARPGRDHFCSHAIIPAEGKFPESNS